MLTIISGTILIRGQLVVPSTTIAIRRDLRFCWYLRLVSVVMNTSKLRLSAAASNSPFFRVAQPSSKAVETECPGSACRNGAGVPWSNKTRIQAVANELLATCSKTERTCAKETPGNSWTNSPTGTPSSRFSKSAATGTRDPRNSQAPLTRSASRSTSGQLDHSIMF